VSNSAWTVRTLWRQMTPTWSMRLIWLTQLSTYLISAAQAQRRFTAHRNEMFALSTVQTPVFAIAHFLRVTTPKHLLHETIIVTRIIVRVDVLKPVPVLGKDLLEDAPGRRGFCHHQAAWLRGVGLYVVTLFYHALPTNSTSSSARTGVWS